MSQEIATRESDGSLVAVQLTGGKLVDAREWAILAQIANTVYNTDFVPQGLRGSKPATLACLLYGREQNLGPMTSLAEVAVIEGRPTMSAALITAKLRQAGMRVRSTLILDDGQRPVGARATLVRPDDPEYEHEAIFTQADAIAAGLLIVGSDGTVSGRPSRSGKPSNWDKYPKAMYLARALTALARAAAPDVFIGSVYTAEEMGADVDETGAPVELPGSGSGGEHLSDVGDVETAAGAAPPVLVQETPPADPADGPEATDEPSSPSPEAAPPAASPEDGSGGYPGVAFDLGEYDSLNRDEAIAGLQALNRKQLEYVYWYEERHKNRKGVKDAIDVALANLDEEGERADEAAAAADRDPDPEPVDPEVDAIADAVFEDAPAAPAFVIPEAARPRVVRVTRAIEILSNENTAWRLAAVLANASRAFGRTLESIGEMTDGELDSIWTAVPEPTRDRVITELDEEA